ncbi:hypothetical protein R9C00_06590 [Flammeovirgaceae bacterium SG7u.111]|nr:hypothetical protein [Flammeovirgaceae bacterium SG7u.132]WPO37109.1 hypothetical protein R9C00_06590 [Flammeovirgaceae bacterium SG7u.111]
MLSFFRINDPFRVIGVFLIMLMIRLPMILSGTSLTLPELNWMLLGEQLGWSVSMYSDVWDNTGPLTAAVYWLVDSLFGKSQLAYQSIAMLIGISQAFTFNRFLVRARVFNENTYIPAFLYMLFISISFDFWTLSPVLLSMSFLLLVLRNLFLLDEETLSQEIFKTGLYLAIATLFYAPSFLFLFLTLVVFAMYRTSSARFLLMVVYGFLFVFIIFFTFLFYRGAVNDFVEQYIISYFTIRVVYISWQDMIALTLLPAAIMLFGAFKTFTERGFVNFQVNCQQVMVLWIITCAVSLLLNPVVAPFQLIVFAPAFAFFLTHYFLLIKKRLVAEIQFILLPVLLIFFCYNNIQNIIPDLDFVSYARLTTQKVEGFDEGKKVLVLGNNTSYYLNNTSTSPYLNWKLSLKHFDQMNRYSILLSIFDHLEAEPPEVIVDEANVAEELFDKMPLLAKKYKQAEGTNYYYRVN